MSDSGFTEEELKMPVNMKPNHVTIEPIDKVLNEKLNDLKLDKTGAESYREIALNMGGLENASNSIGGAAASGVLKSTGIKGIRYKDGDSRGAAGLVDSQGASVNSNTMLISQRMTSAIISPKASFCLSTEKISSKY